MKKTMYFALCTDLALLIAPLSARHVITREWHGMRSGDTLYRQQMEFADPGPKGSNVGWDFSRLSPADVADRVVYTAENDSVFRVNERQTNYFYRTNDDTLYIGGYDNLTTKMDYILPVPHLRYPFAFGDSLTGYFYEEGVYGRNVRLRVSGFSVVRADGWGTLVLPEGDTLHNTLRVYERKRMTRHMAEDDSVLFRINRDSTLLLPDSIEARLKRDTTALYAECWKWYARGYRYPVFESRRDRIMWAGKARDYSCTSFYFPPRRQEELDDEPNERLRRFNEKSFGTENGEPQNPRTKEELTEKDVNYTVYPVPVTSTLTVEFYLHKPAYMSLSVYTVQGKRICFFPSVGYEPGVYRQTIPSGEWIAGEYMLKLTFGNLNYTEKILKY